MCIKFDRNGDENEKILLDLCKNYYKDTDEYPPIDVIDENGLRANSQAYFLNEL